MRGISMVGRGCLVVIATLVLAWGPAGAQEPPCTTGVACVRTPEPPAGAPEWRAGLEYGHVRFDGGAALDPWHTASAEVSRKDPGATLIARVNWAQRFGENGVQLEMDAYPHVARGTYAYLNAGYSDASVFPVARIGAEIYTSPVRGTEASLGVRHLEFSSARATIFTGSAGLYRGDYYFSVRPFVTPRDDGASYSGSLLARRYFSSPESYATLVVGAGTGPTESPLEFELQRANSYRVGLYGKTPVRGGLGVRWSTGYEHEELSETGNRDRVSFSLGLESRL
jgi:YaiO family outer membrane protein